MHKATGIDCVTIDLPATRRTAVSPRIRPVYRHVWYLAAEQPTGEKGVVMKYRIIKSSTHHALEEEINKAAAEGWEPVIVYAWNTAPNTADHAVLLRRQG
jgi:hypothetical protein